MSVFADASFLVSLYVKDANSEQAVSVVQKTKPPILLTSLGELEVSNAIALRRFRGQMSASQEKAVRALVQGDVALGVLKILPSSEEIVARALRISRLRTPQLGTRTLDLLQVASALEVQAEHFYTFDQNQARLAKAEGLVVAP